MLALSKGLIGLGMEAGLEENSWWRKLASSANCPDFTVGVGGVITCMPPGSFLRGHLLVQEISENHHLCPSDFNKEGLP